jgi:GNAT superfamily N-acetyltransferase
MTEPSVTFDICGKAVTLRPLHATDDVLEAQFVRNLSAEARRYRFFGGVQELSPAELKLLCEMDGRRSMAFVATLQEDGHETAIGVSRYALSQREDTREMALSVADDWRHTGLAERLLNHLIDYAKRQGVKQLYCVELSDNHDMRQLARTLGMRTELDPTAPDQVIYTLAL